VRIGGTPEHRLEWESEASALQAMKLDTSFNVGLRYPTFREAKTFSQLPPRGLIQKLRVTSPEEVRKQTSDKIPRKSSTPSQSSSTTSDELRSADSPSSTQNRTPSVNKEEESCTIF